MERGGLGFAAAILAVGTLLPLPSYGDQPYLRGRVLVDDGSLPPKPAAIQLRCGAAPITEGYANSEGYFDVQVGLFNPDEFQDASSSAPIPVSSQNAHHGLTSSELMHCQLLARVAGYASQPIDLGRRRSLDDPDVGVILLHRLGPSEGLSVSATSRAAPKAARRAYRQGLQLARAHKLDDAEVRFQRAVGLDPGYAAAWCGLGRVQAARGKSGAARSSFERSIADDGKFVIPYVELSALEYRERRWQPLAGISAKAIQLDPLHYPQIFFLHAVANYNLHNLPAAEQSARRAETLDVNHQIPGVLRLLGTILAERQDWNGAANEFRRFLKLVPDGPEAEQVRTALLKVEQSLKAAPLTSPR